MQGEIPRNDWQAYLDDFSRRNAGRTAHVDVFSTTLGAQEAAESLPLNGITFDDKGSEAPSIEIMLGATPDRHLSHTATDVRRIVPKPGPGGREEALQIEKADGTRMIIVFETPPEIPKSTS